MNKFLMFPLALLVLAALFVSLFGNSIGSGKVDITSPTGTVNVNGTDQSLSAGTTQTKFLGIWSQESMIVILLAAVALGIVAGITIFSSGFSGLSQSIIFNAALYMSLWAMLSATSWGLFSDESLMGVGIMGWVLLTFSYIIGFAQQVSGGEA
jgi:hypothetical protein